MTGDSHDDRPERERRDAHRGTSEGRRVDPPARPGGSDRPNPSSETKYLGRSRDRGQAYTLEGFISAIVVLTALLFALQSVVITPTTGGSVDRTVQAQLQQEAADSLVVAENDGELSRSLRNWDEDSDGEEDYNWSDRTDSQAGYYSYENFSHESAFGTLLEKRFKESGRSYNVEVVHRTDDGDDRDSFYLVYQGAPTSNAFVASHTVVLTDDMRLTAPENDDTRLEDVEENYPIPDSSENSELYNVVEVRVIVW